MPDPIVVLIEDEPQIRRFLRATLTGQGYRLFEAATGADGLVEVGSRQPDVIIIDLGLPDMDGVDVIRRLREWTAVPIIVLPARRERTRSRRWTPAPTTTSASPSEPASCRPHPGGTTARRRGLPRGRRGGVQGGRASGGPAASSCLSAAPGTPDADRVQALTTLIRYAGKVDASAASS
jgi:CheY-like chemotaxis protein